MTESNAAALGAPRYLEEPIPRAVVLAAWLTAWTQQRCSAEEFLIAVEPFGPHQLVTGHGTFGLLVGLSDLGIHPAGEPAAVRAVLPVAGDTDGLPGPPAFNQAAVAAGQAVVFLDSGIGLVPGNAQPDVTDWTVQPVDSANLRTPSITAEQAASEVRAALLQATQSLGALAQTTSRDAVEDEVKLLSRRLDRTRLPRSLAPERHHTVRLAAQVLGICAISGAHVDNQVTVAAAHDQSATLRELSRTARRALAAAVSTR